MRSLYQPQAHSVFASSSDWLLQISGGTVASILCVIAVALLGFAMLSGRIDLRRGVLVVLGCFFVLGAGSIAQAFVLLGGSGLQSGEGPGGVVVYEAEPEKPVKPASFDPYAGASLRKAN